MAFFLLGNGGRALQEENYNLEGLIQELCLGMFPHLHLPYANGHQSLSLLLFKYPNSLHPHCHCSVQDRPFLLPIYCYSL